MSSKCFGSASTPLFSWYVSCTASVCAGVCHFTSWKPRRVLTGSGFQLDSASALGVSNQTLRIYGAEFLRYLPGASALLRVLGQGSLPRTRAQRMLGVDCYPLRACAGRFCAHPPKATERGLSGFRAGHWRSFGVPSSAHASSKTNCKFPNWFQNPSRNTLHPTTRFLFLIAPSPVGLCYSPGRLYPTVQKPKPLSLLPASTNELRKSVLVRLV